jgi:hypothetical protein
LDERHALLGQVSGDEMDTLRVPKGNGARVPAGWRFCRPAPAQW